jgi:hypothetical protein
MLEPPAIPKATILACLRSEFGLRGASLTFLPLGADLGSAAPSLVPYRSGFRGKHELTKCACKLKLAVRAVG